MLSAFLADSLIRISLPFLFVKNFFTFLSYFFKSDNILYIKPFHQHYLHKHLVHYAHKRLWQIKSHSYLMNGFSGEDGIRTHAPVKTNGFQDRPVMTTSVPLHSYFIVSHQRLDYIIIRLFICQHFFEFFCNFFHFLNFDFLYK